MMVIKLILFINILIQNPKQQLINGVKLANQKLFKQAIEVLSEAYENEPKPQTAFFLAYCYNGIMDRDKVLYYSSIASANYDDLNNNHQIQLKQLVEYWNGGDYSWEKIVINFKNFQFAKDEFEGLSSSYKESLRETQKTTTDSHNSYWQDIQFQDSMAQSEKKSILKKESVKALETVPDSYTMSVLMNFYGNELRSEAYQNGEPLLFDTLSYK